MPIPEQDILHQAAVEGVIKETLDEELGINTSAELTTRIVAAINTALGVDTAAELSALIVSTIDTELGVNTVIADLAAPSATYVEAEALASRDKINAILAALRVSKIIPTV